MLHTPIGPLTVDRHRQLKQNGLHLRVFVRGEDVTDRCYFADDTPGLACAALFRVDSRGHSYLDEDLSPAVEVATEDVEIREANP